MRSRKKKAKLRVVRGFKTRQNEKFDLLPWNRASMITCVNKAQKERI